MNGFNCRATTKISLIIPGFSDSLTASQSRGVMYIVLYLLMSMVQDLLQWPSNRANDNMATESKQGSVPLLGTWDHVSVRLRQNPTSHQTRRHQNGNQKQSESTTSPCRLCTFDRIGSEPYRSERTSAARGHIRIRLLRTVGIRASRVSDVKHPLMSAPYSPYVWL